MQTIWNNNIAFDVAKVRVALALKMLIVPKPGDVSHRNIQIHKIVGNYCAPKSDKSDNSILSFRFQKVAISQNKNKCVRRSCVLYVQPLISLLLGWELLFVVNAHAMCEKTLLMQRRNKCRGARAHSVQKLVHWSNRRGNETDLVSYALSMLN